METANGSGALSRTGGVGQAARQGLGAPDPVFTVVVPVFRQWDKASLLVASLAAQDASAPPFEAVLVDNGTPDFREPESLPPGIRVLRCERPGSYAARNAGAQAARGRWLAFTDADCVADPAWLGSLAAAVAQGGEGRLLSGAVRMVAVSQAPGPSEIYDLVKGIPQERYIRRGYGATANLAVPAAVFRKVGGFDPARFSGGDAEFCRRAGRAGFPISLVRQAVVAHPARTAWHEIATKARRIKGGQMRPGSAWRHRTLLGTLVPPVFGLWYFLSDRRHPLRRRIVASAVLLRVWTVEVAEFARIRLGGERERR